MMVPAVLLLGLLMMVPVAASATLHGEVPDWVRDVALYWANGQVSDTEFLNAIGWLVSNGIIILAESEPEEPEADAEEGGSILDMFFNEERRLDECPEEIADIKEARKIQLDMKEDGTATPEKWDKYTFEGNKSLDNFDKMDCDSIKGVDIDTSPFLYWDELEWTNNP